jgi:hypothetical protein
MTATITLPATEADGDRMSYLARLRMRMHRHRLDLRLAAGADPAGDPELRCRAGELTSGKKRYRLAAVLDRILAEAEGPPVPFETSAPLARGPLRACAPEIQRIVERLDGGDPVACLGVARLAVLIQAGSGPLYRRETTEADLRRELAEISAAL